MPEPQDPAAEIASLRKRLRRAKRKLAKARGRQQPDLDPGQIRHLHSRFTPTPADHPCSTCGSHHPGPCETCGGLHARKCPRVREIEYEQHGDQVLIKRVKFWRDWDATGVLFPDDLPPMPDEAGQ